MKIKNIFYFAFISLLLLSCKNEENIITPDSQYSKDFDKRNYIVSVPDTYDSGKPSPLLFAIHGVGIDAEYTQKTSGFDELTKNERYIVVYPNSIDGFWADGCGCQIAELEGIDDVKFIDYLIDKMKNEYNIDTNRIYAWGISQGGIFAQQLACRRSEKFAAIASYIGSMRIRTSDICYPKKPINMIMFNGTNDQDVFWDGLPTTEFAFLPIPELFSKWQTLNNCSGVFTTDTIPDKGRLIEVEVISYSDCASNKETVLYKMNNAIHAWYRNDEIDTSEEAVKFFNRHRLNE